MFSSRNFMVSGLMFKSSIHFDNFNFCLWYNIVAHLHSFADDCPVFQTPLIEEICLFPTVYFDSFVLS